MPMLRSRSLAVASLATVGAASCTAILGVDEDYVVGDVGGLGGAHTTVTGVGGTGADGGVGAAGGGAAGGGSTGGGSTGGGAAGGSGAGGAGSCWAYQRKLTFDNSAQAQELSSFPVLIVLDEMTFDYAKAEPDGSDLRFFDDDGATQLPFHVEQWDPTGTSFLWVRVPSIDASSAVDHVWMRYGRPGAIDVQDEAGTYDADHVAVWHLSETSGAQVDSAGGLACLWLGGGTGSQDAAGQIAGANDFDGAADALTCGAVAFGDGTDHTITAWVRLPLTGDLNQEVVCAESTSGSFAGLGLYVRRTDGAIGKWLSGSYHYATTAANRVPANEWTFLAIRGHRSNPGGNLEVSKNGGAWETIVSGNTSNLAVPAATQVLIGKWPGPGEDAATRGMIDEVRIANVARSNEWIRAEYLSSSNQFVTLGDEEQICP